MNVNSIILKDVVNDRFGKSYKIIFYNTQGFIFKVKGLQIVGAYSGVF